MVKDILSNLVDWNVGYPQVGVVALKVNIKLRLLKKVAPFITSVPDYFLLKESESKRLSFGGKIVFGGKIIFKVP